MEIEVITVGPLQVNCYLLKAEDGSGLIIDPGDDGKKIIDAVNSLGMRPAGILLTHGHVDHIRAVPETAAEFNIPVSLQPDDEVIYNSPRNEVFPLITAADNLPPLSSVDDKIPGLQFDIIPTPGHTRGGCCYYFRRDNILFSGDTLFKGSVGRTDLEGGDSELLIKSITDKLLPLPPSTVIYPGHGPVTTIQQEITANPFLQN